MLLRFNLELFLLLCLEITAVRMCLRDRIWWFVAHTLGFRHGVGWTEVRRPGVGWGGNDPLLLLLLLIMKVSRIEGLRGWWSVAFGIGIAVHRVWLEVLRLLGLLEPGLWKLWPLDGKRVGALSR